MAVRKIESGDHAALINYEKLGQAAQLSVPSPDHYWPMLYILGLQEKNDELRFFNRKTTMGSVSMTSFIFS
jgi:4,5-DOPA dioxygenase extradiol